MKTLSGREMIRAARDLARKAHMGQVDKAGADYFLHTKKVADLVEYDEEKTVAYLHDIVEDTPVTLDELAALGFSGEIVDAVRAITKIQGEEYETYLWRVAGNAISRRVKLADMQHNSDSARFPVQDEHAKANAEKYQHKMVQLIKLSTNR